MIKTFEEILHEQEEMTADNSQKRNLPITAGDAVRWFADLVAELRDKNLLQELSDPDSVRFLESECLEFLQQTG